MNFKIKNISKGALSLYVVKGGKNSRVSLKIGEIITVDAVRTSQISFFEKGGKISVNSSDSIEARVDRIVTDGAIMPQIKISKEEYLNDKNKEENKKESRIVVGEINSLIKEIEDKSIDYKKILEDNVSIIFDKNGEFDINVIIPVRGRLDFAKPMYNSFAEARKKSDLKISYTIVEYSENPEHSKFCKDNKINYIWIKSEANSLFNKCLAHNVGALFSVKTKYFLFHDIDCLMQSDFFLNLSKNIDEKKCKAIQNFTKRRVLYLNPELTAKVIQEEFLVDNLSLDMPEVSLPSLVGAPGGSITIEKELFFEVGGYDPELFLANSPEDVFFWTKVDAIDKMEICDDPDIELYHMYHRPTYLDNPFIREMSEIYNVFKRLSEEEKKTIISLKSEIIKKFKND